MARQDAVAHHQRQRIARRMWIQFQWIGKPYHPRVAINREQVGSRSSFYLPVLQRSSPALCSFHHANLETEAVREGEYLSRRNHRSNIVQILRRERTKKP